MQNPGRRRFQSEISAIAGETGVVGKSFRMIAEADLVVGVVVAAVAADEFRLPVALEPRASHDIKDTVGAVAVFGVVATTLNLEIVDVLGIELRADIGRDV